MATVRDNIEKMEAEEAAAAAPAKPSALDIRFFIGLLFTIYGAIIALYGLFNPAGSSSTEVTFNLNLWWGILLLIFGLVFYIPSEKPKIWEK